VARFKRQRVHKPERDRIIFQVLRAVRHLSAQEISQKSGVSVGTIYNWRNGTTLYPRVNTLASVARVAGMKLELVPIHEPATQTKRPSISSEARIALN
jgi:transcriptional regulator with XRE-family HTH domain